MCIVVYPYRLYPEARDNGSHTRRTRPTACVSTSRYAVVGSATYYTVVARTLHQRVRSHTTYTPPRTVYLTDSECVQVQARVARSCRCCLDFPLDLGYSSRMPGLIAHEMHAACCMLHSFPAPPIWALSMRGALFCSRYFQSQLLRRYEAWLRPPMSHRRFDHDIFRI